MKGYDLAYWLYGTIIRKFSAVSTKAFTRPNSRLFTSTSMLTMYYPEILLSVTLQSTLLLPNFYFICDSFNDTVISQY